MAAVRFGIFFRRAVSAVLMRTAALRAVTSAVRDSTCQGSRESRGNSTGYCTRAALSSGPVCRAYTSEADSYRTFDEADKAENIRSLLYLHSSYRVIYFHFNFFIQLNSLQLNRIEWFEKA